MKLGFSFTKYPFYFWLQVNSRGLNKCVLPIF